MLLKKDMIQQITFINLGAKGISNIEGIEVFNNLQTVWLHRNYDLESIEPLRNLERLKNVTLYFTKVNDIELLLQNNEINNFEMVYEAGVLPGVNIDTLELPKFIYQSLTMQEGVTAEVNIYFDISYNEEYDYYYCTNENHKTTVPIVINEEQQNATIKLNKTISEQMLIGPRRVEIIIHGGKTDESSYSAIYYVEKEFDRLRIYGGPIKSHYMVGENFEREGMVVYAVYSDGSRHEIFDYTVLDGENLQAGQNSVTISYTEDGITKTDTQEIFVHGEEDLITVKFPDDNLYNAMKEPDSLPDGGRGVYKDLIMGYNDEENEIIMLKEVVDQVDSLHLMQKGISDITGIENFTNLERLFLSFNYNLESIEQLSSLNKLEHVELQITKVEDISPILSKESIQNIVLRKDDQNVINADMTEVVLPPYIYQSLTMQEGVTAEAYIYYSPSCYEGYYFNNDLEGEKKLTEVIIDEENDVAVVLLDKELTDDQDVGVRGIEVTIRGGKTDGALYIGFYNNLEEIEITEQPTKTRYVVGESFSTSGMIVCATYQDNSTREINNYTIIDGEELQLNQNSVTVSYKENGITKTSIQNISVVEETEEEILTSESQYFENEENITGIMPDTSIDEFLRNIKQGLQVQVIHNNETVTSGKIGTGMTIKIMKNGEEIKSLVAIVTGDCTGDGMADIKDMVKINNFRLYGTTTNFGENYQKAADTNKDGKIDIKDMVRINNYRLYGTKF